MTDRLIGIADEYGTIWSGEPGASDRVGDLIQRPDEETCEVRLTGRAASWTFREAVHQIRDDLITLQNAPHAEHEGPVCPICVLTNRMLAALREQSDA